MWLFTRLQIIGRQLIPVLFILVVQGCGCEKTSYEKVQLDVSSATFDTHVADIESTSTAAMDGTMKQINEAENK